MISFDVENSLKWVYCQAVRCQSPFHAEALGLLQVIRENKSMREDEHTREIYVAMITVIFKIVMYSEIQTNKG
jgi:hypothetical protein